MGHPKFSEQDFLGAALAIIAERGVSGVTVASVSERLGSPTGSFYHRFASRDVLLGDDCQSCSEEIFLAELGVTHAARIRVLDTGVNLYRP